MQKPRDPHGALVPGQHVQLEILEDTESVQVAISVVINALATGQLETRRATALLTDSRSPPPTPAACPLSPGPTK